MGTVHFVGAGSGAPDLITLRGKALLERADVVVFAGSLVNPKLLTYAKDGAAIFDSKDMSLLEIVKIMAESALEGKEVVRLHSGDPGIFGAVREQMRELSRLGVQYDVCPGVSSFLAASAALGTEYTAPGVSSSVAVTRASGRTRTYGGASIKDLAALKISMAILLSAGLIDDVVAELAEGGCAPDTPAAIAYKVGWPDEKILKCRVSELAAVARRNEIDKTAVIMVGEFLGDSFETSKLYDPGFSTSYRSAAFNRGTGEKL